MVLEWVLWYVRMGSGICGSEGDAIAGMSGHVFSKLDGKFCDEVLILMAGQLANERFHKLHKQN